MFDRLDMGSAQTYYWLLQSLVGLREINSEAWQACFLLISAAHSAVMAGCSSCGVKRAACVV